MGSSGSMVSSVQGGLCFSNQHPFGGRREGTAYCAAGKPANKIQLYGVVESVELSVAVLPRVEKAGDRIYIPYPRESGRIAASLSAGALSIEVDAVPSWLRTGDFLFLSHETRLELVRAYEISGAIIHLQGAAQNAYAAGDRLFRAVPSRLDDGPQASAIVANAGTAVIRATGDPVDNWHDAYDPLSALPPGRLLNGKEYFDVGPQWSGPALANLIPTWSTSDTGRGRYRVPITPAFRFFAVGSDTCCNRTINTSGYEGCSIAVEAVKNHLYAEFRSRLSVF